MCYYTKGHSETSCCMNAFQVWAYFPMSGSQEQSHSPYQGGEACVLFWCISLLLSKRLAQVCSGSWGACRFQTSPLCFPRQCLLSQGSEKRTEILKHQSRGKRGKHRRQNLQFRCYWLLRHPLSTTLSCRALFFPEWQARRYLYIRTTLFSYWLKVTHLSSSHNYLIHGNKSLVCSRLNRYGRHDMCVCVCVWFCFNLALEIESGSSWELYPWTIHQITTMGFFLGGVV